MTTAELRSKYLSFFKSKGHAIIPSTSLLPENDPSVLFVNSGMFPLVPYLMGEKHPAGNRLTDCQKCIRTGDIEDVGDNRHLTFFEMLGNWSLGDYFKKDAIAWSFEFLTGKEWLNIDPKRLFVTVYRGDDDVSLDEESIAVWREQFAGAEIDAEVSLTGLMESEDTRIFALGKDDNWWGLATGGPCGPDTEMFYDVYPERGFEHKSHEQLVREGRFVEIWNDVFMQYERKDDGSLGSLAQQNVDTGMGVERTVAVLNGFAEVFDIDEFQEIFREIEKYSNKRYEDNRQAFRIIADHVRASVMILGDEKGVSPSNTDQGYILRRLIRRALRYAKEIGTKNFGQLQSILQLVVDQLASVYPEIENNREFITRQFIDEQTKFATALENGLRVFNRLSTVTGKDAFDLYQSHGFPIEITVELAKEKGIEVDVRQFEEELKKHQELSRLGSEQKFKGGLADSSEQTAKLHTATHLMLVALRKVLGEHVYQKGSNITAERLRFDFNHDAKVTPEQLQQVEELVNGWVSQDLEVKCEELPIEQAKEKGAMGVFTDKYGEVVKIYSIGDVSCEMCGGPHAVRTGDLGHFQIQKEEASSAGVRRIKAVLQK